MVNDTKNESIVSINSFAILKQNEGESVILISIRFYKVYKVYVTSSLKSRMYLL